jgi:hypothetical protein
VIGEMVDFIAQSRWQWERSRLWAEGRPSRYDQSFREDIFFVFQFSTGCSMLCRITTSSLAGRVGKG